MLENLRVGTGIDAHRLVLKSQQLEDSQVEGGTATSADYSKRKLMIGGVEIDSEYCLLGHSDADLLLHAIMDALLGPTTFSDIGKIFPDSSKEYKDIDSMILLRDVRNRIKDWAIINLDCTLVAQVPKFSGYTQDMRKNISTALDIDVSRVSIKATTTEYMGFVGRKEGIAAFATVLLSRV